MPASSPGSSSNIDALLARDAGGAGSTRSAAPARSRPRIVGRDEREHGERALLNLGHTFGHAIEAATGYADWLHGEAVASGMVIAADMSQRLGSLAATDVERMPALLQRAGLAASRRRRSAPTRALGVHAHRQEGARPGACGWCCSSARATPCSPAITRTPRCDATLRGALRHERRRHRLRRRARAVRRARCALARPAPSRAAARSIAANSSATAIASSTPTPSAGWSTRPRCSSTTKATCTARASRIRSRWRRSRARSRARCA